MNKAEKAKVAQIKEEMGRGWLAYLMENAQKSHDFVSKMVNQLQTNRTEWQWVIKRIEEQKALKAENERKLAEALS
jgi:hypothetical protein